MPRVLHILPHPGGGGEVLVDLVSELRGWEHERDYVSRTRSRVAAVPSVAASRLRLRRRAAAADLVHVVGDMATLLSLHVLRRRPGVWGTQGLHFLRRARGLRGVVARRGIRTAIHVAECVICSSRAELEELSALAAPADGRRLLEIPNGVHVPGPPDPRLRQEVRSALGLDDVDVVGLYLGELQPRKDPLLAVEAAAEVGARGLPFVLLVAGDGPMEQAVRERSGETIRPLGFRDDAARLLQAADVLVMPSSHEGLSLAVLEGMAHGLAVAVSDGPGNPQAVGDAGVVFPRGDSGALADVLARLTTDPDERRRLGEAARARAQSRFSVERFLGDMREVFEAVLGTRPTEPAPGAGGERASAAGG